MSDLHHYRSPEDFLLRVGRFFEPRVPKEAGRGPMGQCYGNAAALALGSPEEFFYCEGYAVSLCDGAPFACEHAWACDREGRLVEVTWPVQGFGGNFGLERLAFFGVPFPHDILLMSIATKPQFKMLEDEYNNHPILWNRYSEREFRLTLCYVARQQFGRRIMVPGPPPGEG